MAIFDGHTVAVTAESHQLANPGAQKRAHAAEERGQHRWVSHEWFLDLQVAEGERPSSGARGT